ncbi:hypothetical protein H4217_006148 [Coemansia sp. RSA 1939]|nr:hypothetical protein H4217_006148 [Coemansia sp. RSA 1939]KAJ2606227.1 hypothetical protein EV177_005970 [Coemansia sp. RSA 1804]
MTYPNPEVEKIRVMAAQSLGMSLDMRYTGDLVIVILLSCIYGINLLATLFVLINRNYPPIRSKGPLILVVMYISSACWFIGDLQVNGHVTLVNSSMTDCRGYGFWVRILLGVCNITGLISIRAYIFYRIFVRSLPARGFRFFLPIGTFFACLLAIGIVISVLSPSKSVEYVPHLDLCSMDKPLKITIYVLLWVMDGFTSVITWRNRNIKSSFRELREMVFSLVIMFTALIFNTAMQFAHPYYPFKSKYRIASTIFDTAACNAIWWGIMAKPFFQCLFRRQQYLHEWMTKLCEDGLQKEYQVSSSQTMYANQDGNMDQYKEVPEVKDSNSIQTTGSRMSFRYGN